MSDLALNLLYVHTTMLGYARLGVKLAAALQSQGVTVYDTLGEHETNPTICNTVCWVSTPTHARGWYQGQRTVLFSMWEAQQLPEAFRENMDCFDQVIVPSTQNVELFSRYHPNVAHVPLGVDTAEWKYVPRDPPEREFNFLIGGSGKRKGTDLAYRAFKKVFKTWPAGMPIPRLQMKSPRNEDFCGERIERIGGRISDQAERDLYANAHCYLQPSRGEGWGLQPLQAMATGMPTILTDAHGHAEFAHLGYPISAGFEPSDYFIYGDAGDWWAPNFDELCQRMEYVYLNYDKALAYARRSAAIVAEQFSWEQCATRFRHAVGDDALAAAYTGDRSPVEPVSRLYLVRVTRIWIAQIAGRTFEFYPGRDYYEPADVKRILFENQVLDPSCIRSGTGADLTEVEAGLSPRQLASLGEYSASMAYCHSCGQMLNSGKLADL